MRTLTKLLAYSAIGAIVFTVPTVAYAVLLTDSSGSIWKELTSSPQVFYGLLTGSVAGYGFAEYSIVKPLRYKMERLEQRLEAKVDAQAAAQERLINQILQNQDK